MTSTHAEFGPWAKRGFPRPTFATWGPEGPEGPGGRGGPGGFEQHAHPRRDPRGHRGGRRGFGPGFGPGFGQGFGGAEFFGRGRGRGGRGRRGDVRAAILLLLETQPMHGYELIQKIKERSDNFWRPSPGSIYPALAQLEDEGLVLIEKVAGRKTARLTESGEQYIEAHRDDLGDPWADVKGDISDDALDLRGHIGQLMGATAQVGFNGTPEQIRQAAAVLADARRKLYRILAEDEQASGDSGTDDPAEQGEA